MRPLRRELGLARRCCRCWAPAPRSCGSWAARRSAGLQAVSQRRLGTLPGRQQARACATAEAAGASPVAAAPPPHTPVLLDEVLSAFEGRQLHTFVDGTLGAGGHSAAMLTAHPEMQALLGIDVDPQAHAIARARLEPLQSTARLLFAQRNYSQVETALREAGLSQADGILLDLGVSSMQLDTAARGFSIARDGPLDMRMGPAAAASAAHIVNTWPERLLADTFWALGEERRARALAARLVDARAKAPIRTTGQLAAALAGGGGGRGRGRIHPATRVFQALRIAVNRELEHLEAAVPACVRCLAPGGRLAIITFHSLEDRIVKRAFLAAAGKGDAAGGPAPGEPGGDRAAPALGRVLTRKPIPPGEAEQRRNPRSRSAKLRVFERT